MARALVSALEELELLGFETATLDKQGQGRMNQKCMTIGGFYRGVLVRTEGDWAGCTPGLPCGCLEKRIRAV